MPSFVPTSRDTLEDQRRYTQERLVEVACHDCLVRVGVKKNSEHHTSIQWGPDGPAQCPEFQRLAAEPGGRPVHAACERLRAAIDDAVRSGAVTIGATDGW